MDVDEHSLALHGINFMILEMYLKVFHENIDALNTICVSPRPFHMTFDFNCINLSCEFNVNRKYVVTFQALWIIISCWNNNDDNIFFLSIYWWSNRKCIAQLLPFATSFPRFNEYTQWICVYVVRSRHDKRQYDTMDLLLQHQLTIA